MNILIYFGPQLNPQRGGTERVACMIADYLLSIGHNVSYMASTLVEDNLSRKSVFLPDGNDAPTAANIAFVKKYIEKNQIDMILNESLIKELESYRQPYIGKEKNTQNYAEKVYRTYTCSFSTNKDSLTMWNYYATSGVTLA